MYVGILFNIEYSIIMPYHDSFVIIVLSHQSMHQESVSHPRSGLLCQHMMCSLHLHLSQVHSRHMLPGILDNKEIKLNSKTKGSKHKSKKKFNLI